ncbi:MAG: transporter [Pseudomonadales bacterium]|nr:transporter [Pseudomonadales bacterium]
MMTKMRGPTEIALGLGLFLGLSGGAYGHDPVFGPGPHVLFEGGTEIHTEFHRSERGDDTENEAAIALKYGLTGDWVVGLELPYQFVKESGERNDGVGDITFSTKYRFWRHDTLGVQESMAALLKVKPDSSNSGGTPSLGSGSSDTVAGLTYGYESLKWYRWASLRYRYNGKTDEGLHRGDKLLVDLAGGIRLTPPNYWKPDTVWFLELNGEIDERAELDGRKLSNSGGQEWFFSPGVMWTVRNFAVKAGVQLPLMSDLNGDQDESDYRARLEFEWHL